MTMSKYHEVSVELAILITQKMYDYIFLIVNDHFSSHFSLLFQMKTDPCSVLKQKQNVCPRSSNNALCLYILLIFNKMINFAPSQLTWGKVMLAKSGALRETRPYIYKTHEKHGSLWCICKSMYNSTRPDDKEGEIQNNNYKYL